MRYLALLVFLLPTMALAQQPTPTPILKKSRTMADPYAQPMANQGSPTGWQRFQGATECTQQGNVLACNNGYKQTVR